VDASIFTTGTTILISGSLHNDGYQVVYATPTLPNLNVLQVSGTLKATESNSSAFVARKIDTLNLEVARLPLLDVTIAEINAFPSVRVPEVDEDYHLDMVHGILSQAYLKRDTETYNLSEAVKYKGLWDGFVEDVKSDQIINTESDEAYEPHYGSI
jgi:hypothetical protein